MTKPNPARHARDFCSLSDAPLTVGRCVARLSSASMRAHGGDSPPSGRSVRVPPSATSSPLLPFVASRGPVPPVDISSINSAMSNSELRMRASPVGRPAQPLAQHAAPGQPCGIHHRSGSRGESRPAPGSSPGATQRLLSAFSPNSLLAALSPRGMHARRGSSSDSARNGHYASASASPPPTSSAAAGTRRWGVLTQVLCFLAVIVLMHTCFSSSPVFMTPPRAESRPPAFSGFRTTTVSLRALMAAGRAPAQLQEELRAALPICGPNEYGDGEWVYDATITKAPYVSHEWDNVCDAVPEARTDQAANAVSKPSIRPELQYRWQPRFCRLVPYSRANFCKLLAGRNILFAGDSIAGQHLSSFVHLLHPTPDSLWIRDEYYRHDVMHVCQDLYPADEARAPAGRDSNGRAFPGIRVGFRRNNFLTLHRASNATEEHRKWSTNQTWVTPIREHKYEILVINTGIWMVNASVYRSMLRDIRKELQVNHPELTMLWRSTQPGHAHCHSHWARPQARLYSIADTSGGSANFRWEEASERNDIARETFPEQFFDVWNATRLRPDGHMPGECLHYCQPGPVDEWHKMLYHRLALQKPEFVQEVLERESAMAAVNKWRFG